MYNNIFSREARKYLAAIVIHRYTLNGNKFINIVSSYNIIWIGGSWIRKCKNKKTLRKKHF